MLYAVPSSCSEKYGNVLHASITLKAVKQTKGCLRTKQVALTQLRYVRHVVDMELQTCYKILARKLTNIISGWHFYLLVLYLKT